MPAAHVLPSRPARSLGAALLLLSGLCGLTAPAESPKAAALRVQVTQAVIAKWSPDVRFHTWERYFPTSAEDLFRGAKAYRVGAKESDRIGGFKEIRTPADLAGLTKEWRIQFDPGNPKVLGGDVTGTRPNLVVTAPMYVSVQIPADAAYVNLHYGFLFGFNGAQCMRSRIGSFNYIMQSMAEHEGDWEGVDVRLAPDLGSVVLVSTEAHGDKMSYLPSEMDWTESTHPQLRLGLNSHGVYNGKGKNPEDWIILEDLKAAAVIDLITRDGPSWRPWTLRDGFRLFGRANSRPIGKEAWTFYQGRMGTHKTNAASAVMDVDGEPFKDQKKGLIAKAQLTIFKGVSPFLKELFNGMPCTGVGPRAELKGELAPLLMPAGMKRYVLQSRVPGSLVLSVNPADPDGGLILDTLRPGDENQQWLLAENKDNRKDKVNRVCLVNVKTRKLAGVRGGSGARVTLFSPALNTDFTQWTLAGDRGDPCAIHPLASEAQNLNAFGNGPHKPGNPVGIWKSGKGAGNETWKLVEAAR
jgi:hypothetical protein